MANEFIKTELIDGVLKITMHDPATRNALGPEMAREIIDTLDNFEQDNSYLNCLKAGIIAHLQGYAPAVSVEFARKTLGENLRPTFSELEEATGELSPVP